MGETERRKIMQDVVDNPEAYSHKVITPKVSASFEALRFLSRIVVGGYDMAAKECQACDDSRYTYMSFGKGIHPPKAAAEFFCGLFDAIQAEGTHQLSGPDLWHGHVVTTHGSGAFAMVFHAKEFPSDMKAYYPKAPLGKSSTDPNHGYRNLLWLAEANKIYMLDCTDNSVLHKKIVQDQAAEVGDDALAFRKVDQSDVGEGKVDVFYLSAEGPRAGPEQKIVCAKGAV